MNEKGLYEDLKAILIEGCDLRLLRRYHKALAKNYPEQMRAFLRQMLLTDLSRATNHRQYRAALDYLAYVAELPDGEDAMRELATTIRSCWPRRKALIDELVHHSFRSSHCEFVDQARYRKELRGERDPRTDAFETSHEDCPTSDPTYPLDRKCRGQRA